MKEEMKVQESLLKLNFVETNGGEITQAQGEYYYWCLTQRFIVLQSELLYLSKT